MKQTISVRFYARKERSTQSGLTPIVMRIAVGKQRLNIGTKLYVSADDWSMEDGKMKTKTREAKKINETLDGFRHLAFDYQRELMHEGRPITLDNMRAKWYNLSLEKKVMLMQVFAQHNKQMKALVNKEFAPLTLERYETSFRHTQRS